MDTINYKQIKNLNNYNRLRKCDPGMTPISTGNLGNDYVGSGMNVIKSPTLFSNSSSIFSEIAGNIAPMMELGKGLGKTYGMLKSVKAANDAALSANEAAAATFGGDAAKNYAALQAAADAGLKATTTSTAATAASKGVAALAALYGGYESIAAADKYGRSPISESDLLNSAGQYINESGALQIGGLPETSGYLRNYNNAGMTSSVTGGMTLGGGAGALIGSALGGPAGTFIGGLLGTGLGALGGAITGWINRGKTKRKINEERQNVASAISGFNRLVDSEARDQIIKNNYYQTHYSADCGKSVKADYGLGLMGGGETKVETATRNGKTVVTNAQTVPISQLTPYRIDNVLFEAKPSTGITGNKFDKDGITFAEKGAVYANMFNSGDPYLRSVGEKGLLKTLTDLGKTPNNNPNPYDTVLADQGRNMKIKKYWNGKPVERFTGKDALRLSNLYNLTAGMLGAASAYEGMKESQAMPTDTPIALVDDKNIMQAVRSLPITKSIFPQLLAINDLTRYGNFAINNNPALSYGQKIAALSLLYSDNMRTISDAYSRYFDDTQKLVGDKATAWMNAANSLSSRRLQAVQEWINNRMKANAAKYNAIAMGRKNILTPIYSMAENAHNNAWQRALNELYEQQLTNEQKKIVNNAGTGTGTFKLPQFSWSPYEPKLFAKGG